MAKEQGRRIPRSSLEDTRRRVIEAIESGLHPEDAAIAYGCGRSTVYGWLSSYDADGLSALSVRKPPGAAPKLSEKQTAKLRQWVVGRDPRQLQFDYALWTREIIRDLVEREFGVTYTLQGLGKLLARLGLSPQRPLVRAYEQDPERVRRWKEEEYPAIRAEAARTGAAVFFADEASARTDYHSGTTWGEVGRTPIVKGTGNRKSVNMASAVSLRGKLYFKFLDGNTNAAAFTGFLEGMLNDIPGIIFVIVDGHSAHTAGATREFAEKNKDRLRLFYLPSYSPELNPDEWVWKNIKHDHAGRMAARTLDEFKNGISKAVSRLLSFPGILLGFFADPDLAYINAQLAEARSSSQVSL
jgi:transposase